MSAPENNPAGSQHYQQDYYPPPPPGPPPGQAPSVSASAQPSYVPPPQQDYASHSTHGHAPYFPPPPGKGSDAQEPHPTLPPRPRPQHPDEIPLPDTNIQAHYPSMQELHDEYSAAELYDNNVPAKQASKSHWSQRFAELGAKAAAPLNALANKVGAEAFLPATMDKECEKAARILRSFCKDGVYSDAVPQPGAPATSQGTPSTPMKPGDEGKAKKPKVILTIPSKVIARAQGLAIFTTVRAGFHVSAASGSGILIARLPDGSWSPPSGIQVHSVGAGFVVGLDIYDCVVVINTREALEAFTKTRTSLGSDLAIAAGPWGAGGSVDWEMDRKDKGKRVSMGEDKPPTSTPSGAGSHATTGTGTASTAHLANPTTGSSVDRKPSPIREALKKHVYSYVKSRGFYAGVQIDGTVITERKDANAAFYGDKNITVDGILAGNVRQQSGPHLWPAAAKGLMEVLAGAEGWRGQQVQQHASPVRGDAGVGQYAQTGAGIGLSGVTEGVRGMDQKANPIPAGGPLSSHPPTQGSGYSSKAAEAEAERRANEPLPAGPPSYQEPGSSHYDGHYDVEERSELPPAYVDDGVPRPGVGDEKTGQH